MLSFIAISQFPASKAYLVPKLITELLVLYLSILLVSLACIGNSDTTFPLVSYLTTSIVTVVAKLLLLSSVVVLSFPPYTTYKYPSL